MSRRFLGWLCLITVFCFAMTGFAADGWVLVDHAVDGDTIRLRSGELVRYLGIDAPEIDHRAGKAEPYGEAALDLNRQLVNGKRIRLQSGHRKYDRYGRLLAHPIDANGAMITALILRQGLACYYPDPDKKARKLKSKLLSIQRDAMKKGLGIWSRPITDKGPFIGNRNSMRFHTLACPYGQKTGQKIRTLFTRRHDAHWEGYAPCRRCLASPIKMGLQRN